MGKRLFKVSHFFEEKYETLNGRLPPEDGSVRLQTLGKRVSDDPRRFIFRRRKKNDKNVRQKFSSEGGLCETRLLTKTRSEYPGNKNLFRPNSLTGAHNAGSRQYISIDQQ